MKKQLLNIAAVLSLSMMLMAVVASAQVERQMTVTVPFAFKVGKITLPAGPYTVYRTNTNGFLIRDAAGTAKTTFSTQPVQAGKVLEQARMDFRRYGDQYFLACIWAGDNNIGRELAKSGLEREVAKDSVRHLAQKGAKPEIVPITAP